MTSIKLNVTKDYSNPYFQMHQDTYTSLDNYFTLKSFPDLVGNKVGSETGKVRGYMRVLCTLYGISKGNHRSVEMGALKSFVGFAPTSTRLKSVLQDLYNYGALKKYETTFKEGIEILKFRVNMDSELAKMFKEIEDNSDTAILNLLPYKYNPIVATEKIYKLWKENNKEAKQVEEEPETIVEEVKVVEAPVEEQTLELSDITGVKSTKVNRDTVAVLTKVYNMKKAGLYKSYEAAAAYYNAHIREALKDYPSAAKELSTPTVRNLFKIWEEEDGVQYVDSSLF